MAVVTHWLFAIHEARWGDREMFYAASLRFELGVSVAASERVQWWDVSAEEAARRMWFGYLGLSMPGHE